VEIWRISIFFSRLESGLEKYEVSIYAFLKSRGKCSFFPCTSSLRFFDISPGLQ
jgi:hypothetical protein